MDQHEIARRYLALPPCGVLTAARVLGVGESALARALKATGTPRHQVGPGNAKAIHEAVRNIVPLAPVEPVRRVAAPVDPATVRPHAAAWDALPAGHPASWGCLTWMSGQPVGAYPR